MAILVHITNFENKKNILRTGIKVGKYNKIVYFMPHAQDYLISHQWARELKRSGIKNFIAVDFKLPTDELVWFGKYTLGHELMQLSKAIEIFINLEDKLGYEFFIERKIDTKEITKIRHISKPVGWRYEPYAHGKKPCSCPICLQAGGYKTNKLKEKYKPIYSKNEAKEILKNSTNEDEILDAITCIKGKWKKESPEFLSHILNIKDEYILYDLTELIYEYRHPLRKIYLEALANSKDMDVAELASEYLEKIKKN